MRNFMLVIVSLLFWACTDAPKNLGDQQTWKAAFRQNPDSAAQAISPLIQEGLMDSAWAHKYLGTYYMRIGTNEPAIEAYLKSLDLYTQQKDSLGMASVFLNLTNVEDREKALLEWHAKSIGLYEAMGDYQGVAKNLVNLGTTYMDEGRLLKADSFYSQALALSKAKGLAKTERSTQLNLAILEHKQGNSKSAISLIKAPLREYRRQRNQIGLVYAYFNLSQFYLEFDADSSAAYVQLCLKEAEDDFPLVQSQCYATLRDLNKAEGNWKQALRFHNISDSLADHLLKLNGQNLLRRMEAEFSLAKTQQKSAYLQKSLQTKLWLNVLISFGILTGLALLIAIISGQRRRLRERKALQDKDRNLIEARNQLKARRLEKLRAEQTLAKEKLNYQRSKLVKVANQVASYRLVLERVAALEEKAGEWFDRPEEVHGFKSELNRLRGNDESAKLLIKEALRLNEGFSQKLEQDHPALSATDRAYLILFDLDLSSKEVASLLEVKERTVNMRRYHIRKKLGLSQGEDLRQFLRPYAAQEHYLA